MGVLRLSAGEDKQVSNVLNVSNVVFYLLLLTSRYRNQIGLCGLKIGLLVVRPSSKSVIKVAILKGH